MWIALVMAVVGLVTLIWPDGLVRTARVYRGAVPAEKTPTVVHAARLAGGMLLIGSLLLALAEG